MQTSTHERPLVAAEVAELLGYGARHVKRLAEAGDIPCAKLPGAKGDWIFWRDEVLAYRRELSRSRRNVTKNAA